MKSATKSGISAIPGSGANRIGSTPPGPALNSPTVPRISDIA
ncbi:Uncharacterised protein [Mycobacteroides abscessus subsp. abscessus]|nr:Uncharacterised protein [Mycobacteroides abscessus subsp. abscessus]